MKRLIPFLAILILSGCSSSPVGPVTTFSQDHLSITINAEVASKVEATLKNELTYIKTITEEDFKNELLKTLSSIHFIDYQPGHCGSGQVACSDKMNDGKIFINQNFFQMPSLEQFTALLHEARHLESQNFEHAKCSKRPEWGYECDENINSPYGLEYKYLLHKFINNKDEQSAQVLQRIFLRVNKI
nr:hypothetical protein BHI3_34090 [Bacteriovorax sp. HI3]